jgi:hypothetical protein
METKVFMIIENDTGSLSIDGKLELFRELLFTLNRNKTTRAHTERRENESGRTVQAKPEKTNGGISCSR